MPDTNTMQNVVNALGWMLIHFLWQGCVIAMVLWVLLRLARGTGANTRYLFGLLGCCAVAVVPAVTLLLMLSRPVSSAAQAVAEFPAISVLASGYGVGGSRWMQLALEPALPVVVGLWALGVVLLSFRTLLGWWAAHRLVRTGVSAVSAELEKLLLQLQQRMRMNQTVALLRSVRVSVPTVVGWIKPIILLPASVITALPRAQLEMVLAHELAHVRRYDYLVNLLQLFIETLFFYHPAVRWISRQVRQEREHCCDDLVLLTCGQPLEYARALTRLETMRDQPLAPALAATGGDLFARVSRIVQREAPRTHSGLAQISLVTVLALVTGLGAQQGLDGAIRHNTIVAKPGSEIAAVSLGLAAIGDGWRRHASNWAPPRPRNNIQVETVAPGQLEPEAPTGNSGTSPDFEPAPEISQWRPASSMPEMPLLASVAPKPSLRREDLLLEPTSMESGQASVTPLNTVSPDYPERALADGVDGFVKLLFRVDERGRATDIRVGNANPEEVFDTAAINALEQWTFQVKPGHDPSVLLAQSFDFAWQEVVVSGSKARSRECMRTGTRICAHPYTESHEPLFRPTLAASTKAKD